ncbi:Rpn family recombination-promoting nuclease/putative transposase [Aliterella atlantica]|uniref:Rpn family recombination-promoting nuclease/putative transposase n=1 Tax=Aliterella atlantica TaxID=1827278 RepID=UPI000ABB1402|nr:Rpn family recombination-promoting nuclease/putative transposase [Aliterella atlantica]
MLDYWVRLYRRYNLPVTQVIILLKETSVVVPNFFEVEQTRHSYRVVRMWEQDPETLLQDTALLPLASLCRTSEPNGLLSRVAEQVANIETTAQKGQITACTEILAGLRFDDNLIKQLFKEDVMQESVVYQRILREGLQQGLEQGLRTSISDALQNRFGSVPENLTEQLALLTPEILQQLNRQAWTCQTLEEFMSQLPRS